MTILLVLLYPIAVAQIAAAVTGTDPMVNPAVQQIVALEAQIAALRAQL